MNCNYNCNQGKNCLCSRKYDEQTGVITAIIVGVFMTAYVVVAFLAGLL